MDQFQAGTAPRIDATRTEVQLHTEEYNLSVARNNFAVGKLALARAIGLPFGQEFDLADKLPYQALGMLTQLLHHGSVSYQGGFCNLAAGQLVPLPVRGP